MTNRPVSPSFALSLFFVPHSDRGGDGIPWQNGEIN